MAIDERLALLRSLHIGLMAHGIEGATGPAEQLFDYLVDDLGVREVSYVRYPLVACKPRAPILRMSASSDGVRSRTLEYRRIAPPASYLLDALDRSVPRCDVWIAFDPVLALSASLRARWNRACVVSWHVDYAPDRGSAVANMVYAFADRSSYDRCQLQVDISLQAREARRNRYPNRQARHVVIPFATSVVDGVDAAITRRLRRRVVFAGALERRTGAHRIPAIAMRLKETISDIEVVVIGSGSLRSELEEQVRGHSLEGTVQMLGFIESHSELLERLCECDLALAPYDPDHAGFSKYSDPGKIKTYISCGLPVVVSEMATSSREVAVRDAGIVMTSDDPFDWAAKIVDLLADEARLEQLSRGALAMARELAPAAIYREFAVTLASVLEDVGALPMDARW